MSEEETKVVQEKETEEPTKIEKITDGNEEEKDEVDEKDEPENAYIDKDDDDEDFKEEKDDEEEKEGEEEKEEKEDEDVEGKSEKDNSKKKKKKPKKKKEKKIKTPKRVTKEDITDQEKQADDIAKQLVSEIQQATADDLSSIQRNEPATARLLIYSKIVENCKKPYLQPSLLESSLLEALAEWIKPTEDGKLPNLNLRTAVLNILLEFPIKGITKNFSKYSDFEGIDIHHLKGSKIGQYVRFLSQHPNETKDNKTTASTIVERWSRLIFGLSDDYKQLKWDQKPQKRGYKQVEEKEELGQSKRARMPKIRGHDFVLMPKSKISDKMLESPTKQVKFKKNKE